MTKNAKAKLARKHAEENARKSHYSIEEVERIKSDVRKQVAEANARIEEERNAMSDQWDEWCAWWNQFVIPRLSVGFYYAAYQIANKYLIKTTMELFMDELSAVMQDLINEVADTELDSYNLYKQKLEDAGYSVPAWAEQEDLEVIVAKMRESRKKNKKK